MRLSLSIKKSPLLNRDTGRGKGVTVRVMKARVGAERGLLLYSSLTSLLMDVSSQFHAPAALSPGREAPVSIQ
jgi:hypothetical protein